MATAKEYNDNVKREINIDVEALLQAIQRRSAGNVQEFIDNEQAHRVNVDGVAYNSYSELAEAFELDIRDYAISEVNR
ncbi:YodD family peroxide/acid resistance protein [Erwinia sp. V71]|uniref:YodD family peroxide/acid resistance protein n=1 Tax=Erwinia sp. V71 TaxID=3369424 RepID=UPI003F6154AD